MIIEEFNPLNEAIKHLRSADDSIFKALELGLIELKKAERIRANLIEIVLRIRKTQEKTSGE